MSRWRRHPLTAVLLILSLTFLVLNMVLATGQWDRDRTTFPADGGTEVHLDGGDERIIYMTANESRALNFDFYPSDFDCSAQGPGGAVPVRLVYHRRLLDLWQRHWSIGSVEADVSGTYGIRCSGRGDAPLVLASPARFTVGWVSPNLAAAVLVAVLLAIGIIQSFRLLWRRRRRPSRAAS